MSPPRWRTAVAALLRKELRVELRTLESVPAMTLFSVTTFVIFHFGLQLQQSGVSGKLASGVLWVTLLFASVLGLNRLFVADAEQGGFDAFLLAPVDRSALLAAKALALLIYLVCVEIVAVPAFAVLLLGPSLGAALPALLVPLALGDLGVVAIGTLVSLPLLVPVVIGAALLTSPLFSTPATAMPVRWLVALALYDAVFAVIAFALFDFLLED